VHLTAWPGQNGHIRNIDTVYYYLQGFLNLGVTSRSRESKAYLYSFNYILWKDLMDFVSSLQEYQILAMVPREALLIKSYGDSVLFRAYVSRTP
jgi:hypothetical protein